MLHLYLRIINAAMTKQALFWAFSLLTSTLSWFSRASLIKLKTSSGIFSPSSNRICFSSSCQFKVKYWTPILSQWFVSYIPAVFTILWTLFEITNSRSYNLTLKSHIKNWLLTYAPYSSQIKSPSLILTTPTRFSSSTSSF
jgi:hypothetical protein